MSEAKIHFPCKGSRVKAPFVPYGTSKGVEHLFGILLNQKDGKIILGKTLHEGSSWDILFADASEGTYSFYLLGFPGGFLGYIPDVYLVTPFDVGISQPSLGAQNLTACFTAAGYASPGGMPSGTVTRVSDGKQYPGTNPTQNGMCWTIQFTVDPTPTATSLFNLHIDVSGGSGSADNDGLGIPNPC